MTVATIPTALDLQSDGTGDAFQVDLVVDHDAGENSGLVEAMADLLIDLYRKRVASQQAADREVA
jgi:hypothetical protein